jgi:hypothetical protein
MRLELDERIQPYGSTIREPLGAPHGETFVILGQAAPEKKLARPEGNEGWRGAREDEDTAPHRFTFTAGVGNPESLPESPAKGGSR